MQRTNVNAAKVLATRIAEMRQWWRQLKIVQEWPHCGHGNGEGSWAPPVIATFRNDRTSFHGGGRDVYDGLSLNQHCCSKTSTGEATYSKIKGLDDCFTEMRKSYTSLFVHKNLRAHSSEGITPFAQLRKFSTIVYDHLWYTSIIFLIFFFTEANAEGSQDKAKWRKRKIKVGME